MAKILKITKEYINDCNVFAPWLLINIVIQYDNVNIFISRHTNLFPNMRHYFKQYGIKIHNLERVPGTAMLMFTVSNHEGIDELLNEALCTLKLQGSC